MPFRRGRGKTTTKGKGRDDPKRPATQKKPVQYLPPEIWRMIIAFACSFDRELSKGPFSTRSLAALGMVDCAFNYAQYVRARHRALETRINVLLVSKAWNEMGKDHTYATIAITDTSRRFIPELIARFLANPKLGEGVRHVELNFSVSRNTVELISAMIRGLLKHCPNVVVVDDFVWREASKRSVSPIEVAMHGAGEIPFAVALGNRHHGSIEQVSFSRESAAAFTPRWFVALWKLLNGIEILCLNDFPGWKYFPIIQENAAGNHGSDNDSNNERGRGSQFQRRPRRRRTRDSEDSEDDYPEYEDDADDEEEKELEPLEFEYLHTLNMSIIKETRNSQFARAFTKYIGSWKIPGVEHLALSIYNAECIPTALFSQVGDNLQTLCLHNFSPDPTPAPPSADKAGVANGSGPRAQTKPMTLEDKKVILPKVWTVMVVANHVDPAWIDTLSCPVVEKYVMSYFSYSPMPHNPDDYGVITSKPTWTAHWTKVRAHLELCLDKTKMPSLKEVWIMDCEFLDGNDFSDDIKMFWTKWEERLGARGVALTGGMRGIEDANGNLFAPEWYEARGFWEPGYRQARAEQRAMEQQQKEEHKGKPQDGEATEKEATTVAPQAAKEQGNVQQVPPVEGQTPPGLDVAQETTSAEVNGVLPQPNGAGARTNTAAQTGTAA